MWGSETGDAARVCGHTGDEDDGVEASQTRRDTVWAIYEDLDRASLLCDAHQALREAPPRPDHEHELLAPRVLALRGPLLRRPFCYRARARGLRAGHVHVRDRERVGLERQQRHARHRQQRALPGGPVEVRRAPDAQAHEPPRGHLGCRVERAQARLESEVRVVEEDDAAQTEEPVEAPEDERRPDVVLPPAVCGVCHQCFSRLRKTRTRTEIRACGKRERARLCWCDHGFRNVRRRLKDAPLTRRGENG